MKNVLVIKDDAPAIVEKMLVADVIVWATPVYYYCVSGQMKTMIDRGNPLFAMDYQFRDVYMLASAAEDAATAVDGAHKAVEGHPALAEAYEAGRAIQ